MQKWLIAGVSLDTMCVIAQISFFYQNVLQTYRKIHIHHMTSQTAASADPGDTPDQTQLEWALAVVNKNNVREKKQ